MQVLEVEAVPHANRILALNCGRLDADDVRAPVGEGPHACGTRASQSQIQDADPGQWQRSARRGLDHEVSMLLPVVTTAGYAARYRPWQHLLKLPGQSIHVSSTCSTKSVLKYRPPRFKKRRSPDAIQSWATASQ